MENLWKSPKIRRHLAQKSHKHAVRLGVCNKSARVFLMTYSPNAMPAGRARVRNLRRARRYLAANEGALARLLNTYAKQVKANPDCAFLPET